MVKKCCIKFCCSESVAGCGISFHSIPKDPELKQKWIDAISRKITKNSVVCSLHFKDNDFQIARCRRTLTLNAIPSIFPIVKLKSKLTSLKYDDIMPLFNMTGKNNVDTSEISLQSPTIREDDEEDQDASKGIMSEDTTEINEVKQEMSTECRTCLQTLHPEEDVYYIFQNWVPPWEGVEDTIAEALQRIANIQLSDVDPHSKVICGTCCQKLHTACLFATLAQQSDYALWQRTSSPSDVSAEKNWPKPIQIDKNIPFDEQMEIKQEHLSDEEYSGYRGVEANPSEEMEIKTEPIELIPRQVVPVQINGHYEGMSSEGLTPEISVNGDDNSQEVPIMNSRAQKLVAMACGKHLSNNENEDLLSEEEYFANVYESQEVTMLSRLKQDPILKLDNTASSSLTLKQFERNLSPSDINTKNIADSRDSSNIIQLEDLDVIHNSLDSTIFNHDLEENIIAEIEVEAFNNLNINHDDVNDTTKTIFTENKIHPMCNTYNTPGHTDSTHTMQKTESPQNEPSIILNSLAEQQTSGDKSQVEDLVEKNEIGRPKRGRKRKIEDQPRKERKRRANVNEKYVSAKGKEVLPKIFDESFHCECKKKCTEIISKDNRKRIFEQFWSLGSYEGRCAFICGKVKQTNKARCYTTSQSKRTYSRKYFLYDTEICKKLFLKTLGICQSRIDVAMKKKNGTSNYKDNRGTVSGGNNKTSENNVKNIVDHINSFPKYISHFCRGKTDSRYLNTDLNLLKMYNLFKSKYSTHDNLPSLATYKKIFYEKFNLRFKALKSITCKTCDAFAANIKSLTGTDAKAAKEKRDLHLSKASALRNKMNADLKLASEVDHIETLTFDMPKTHPLPKIPSNTAYYKRQLNLYNLGIYVGSNKRSIFNLWLEYEGGKGTQEIGSCLRKYILNYIQFPVTHLNLWAESCGGQNRSIKLVLMLIHTMQHHSSLQSITLRFLLPGHSFLPNDADFGVIENLLKTQQRLYTLDDYAESIRLSKKHKKFEVSRMLSSEMLSVKPLEKAITNRKVDSAKCKVNWLNVHEIMMEKNSPYILKIKNDIQEDSQIVNIEKAGKGRKASLKNINLPECWPKGKSLSKEKIKDLKELMKLIPMEAKIFYDFLKTTQGVSIDEDVEGYHAEDIEYTSENEED